MLLDLYQLGCCCCCFFFFSFDLEIDFLDRALDITLV